MFNILSIVYINIYDLDTLIVSKITFQFNSSE